MSRSKLRTIPLLAAASFGLAVILVAVSAFGLWPDAYARHFASPLPESAKLLHYQRSAAGFDVSYVFVFETTDDALLDQIVKEWSLASVPASSTQHPTSFVALTPPSWWLNTQTLHKLPERYTWIDNTKEQYRSVWVDRATGKLYAEYGNW